MAEPIPDPTVVICPRCSSEVVQEEAVLGSPAGMYEVMHWTTYTMREREHTSERCQRFKDSGEPWRTPARYEEK